MGLAEGKAEVGDLVFVVRGTSIPLILRLSKPENDNITHKSNRYKLIGRAYVHGIMDGEMWLPAERRQNIELV